MAKNGRTDYIGTNMESLTRDQVKNITKAHWSIEIYHRCGIERCQARTSRAQRNHISLSIAAWFEKHRRHYFDKISIYQQHWEIIKPAISKEMQYILKTS